MLLSPAGLWRVNPDLPCIPHTDRSQTAIQAILAQEDASGEERPVAFAGQMLKAPK